MPCCRTRLPCLVHACMLSKSPSAPALWQNAAPGTAPPPPPADGKDLDAEFLATGKKSYPASHDLDNIISGGAQAAALPARPLNQDGPYTQGPARRASACALGRWVSSTSCRVVAVPKCLALDVCVCAVAASQQDDSLAWFSNRGSGVHLAAPGYQILSTYNRSNTDYEYLSGTSMATPIVAGAAALLMAAKPGATYSEVRWDGCAAAFGRAFAFNNLPLRRCCHCCCYHCRWGCCRLANARVHQPHPLLLLSPLPWLPCCRSALLDVDPVPALSGQVSSGGRLNVARAMATLLSEFPRPPPPPPQPPSPPLSCAPSRYPILLPIPRDAKQSWPVVECWQCRPVLPPFVSPSGVSLRAWQGGA
jgi:hypothetical protein